MNEEAEEAMLRLAVSVAIRLKQMKGNFSLTEDEVRKCAIIMYLTTPKKNEFSTLAALYYASEGRWAVDPDNLEDLIDGTKEFYKACEEYVFEHGGLIKPDDDTDEDEYDKILQMWVTENEDVLGKTGLYTRKNPIH